MTDRIIPEAGQIAPGFDLPDQNEHSVKLSGLKNRWVVVYFYPKDDTPGCTTEACEFTENLKQFDNLNASVIGISPDSTEDHQKFVSKFSLGITLLSDAGKDVMKAYGAWGKKKLYGRESIGVIRSTFLINPAGNIAHVWKSVKTAGHALKVRTKLEEIMKQQS